MIRSLCYLLKLFLELRDPRFLLPDELFDPGENPIRSQVCLVQDFIETAPGPPVVVPVGADGILLGGLVVEPLMHGRTTGGGNHHGVHPVPGGKNRILIALRLSPEELRARRADDLHVQLLRRQLRQQLHNPRHGAGSLHDNRSVPFLSGRILPHDVRPFGGFKVRRYLEALSVRYFNCRPGKVQRDNRYIRLQGSGNQNRYLVVFPGMKIDDMPFREELCYRRRKDPEVGT